MRAFWILIFVILGNQTFASDVRLTFGPEVGWEKGNLTLDLQHKKTNFRLFDVTVSGPDKRLCGQVTGDWFHIGIDFGLHGCANFGYVRGVTAEQTPDGQYGSALSVRSEREYSLSISVGGYLQPEVLYLEGFVGGNISYFDLNLDVWAPEGRMNEQTSGWGFGPTLGVRTIWSVQPYLDLFAAYTLSEYQGNIALERDVSLPVRQRTGSATVGAMFNYEF